MPNVSELIAALPDSVDAPEAPLPRELAECSLRPVPVGRLRRLGLLGTLQAKIAAAYFFYWVRGWFKNADQRERLLAETHWRTAQRLLDSMGYLRGAVMKVGQMLANLPDIAPQQFVETLDALHSEAPPMHWSLLAEMVRNELGDDPANLFASFDRRAFAAASLGQVHRATLHSGQEVAVEVQYPGIGRALGEDLRNLGLFMLPARLGRDWESVKAQWADLTARLEHESDYEAEAAMLAKVRTLFRPGEGITVPRVFAELSTARVLTMEYLPGLHLDAYLATGPSQQERNAVAEKLVRAWYRMMFAGRLLYLDMHPGNYLFAEDGSVGLLDFGMLLPLDDGLWRSFQIMDRALTTGRRDDRIAALKDWNELTDDPRDADRTRLFDEYADWCWRARYCGGVFDFGDAEDYRQGVKLFNEMFSRRYTRSKPSTPVICRSQFGFRSLLYRLGAKLDMRAIAESEVPATGWDRREYA